MLPRHQKHRLDQHDGRYENDSLILEQENEQAASQMVCLFFNRLLQSQHLQSADPLDHSIQRHPVTRECWQFLPANGTERTKNVRKSIVIGVPVIG